jgi:hypothetical protein
MPLHQPPTPGTGRVPVGWDFPEASAAAYDLDLWALDVMLKLTPWERLWVGQTASQLKQIVENGGHPELAAFVRVL